MSISSPESPYINKQIYDLTETALKFERDSGIKVPGFNAKKLDVFMPEPWHRLALRAQICGDFGKLFVIRSVELELGPPDCVTITEVSDILFEVRDEMGELFISALEQYQLHDHELCVVRYGAVDDSSI